MVTSGHATKMAVTPEPSIIDGSGSHYLIRRSRKAHAARKLHGSIFYRTGVIADRNFTLWE